MKQLKRKIEIKFDNIGRRTTLGVANNAHRERKQKLQEEILMEDISVIAFALSSLIRKAEDEGIAKKGQLMQLVNNQLYHDYTNAELKITSLQEKLEQVKRFPYVAITVQENVESEVNDKPAHEVFPELFDDDDDDE